MGSADARSALARSRADPHGARPVAKKPNYDFEKRKKEQDRKKKKDAKREERLARKRDGLDPDLMDAEEVAEGVESPEALSDEKE